MSLILVDGLKDRPGTGGPKFPNGLHLPAGIGITGDGHINMAGVSSFSELSVSGNVTIGGTLTYEDVTNIDVVGVSTFAGRMNVNSTIQANEGINVSAGVGTFAGDVSIADKIIHTGDTNTAIRFPTTDAFSVETSGSEAIRVDSSGRLLIKETSVAGSAPLCVGNGGQELFEFTPGSATYNGGLLEYIHRSDGNTRPDLNMYVAGAGAFKVYTSGANERARITSGGKIGINTSNPGNNMVELHHDGTSSPTTALTIGGRGIVAGGGAGVFLKASSNTEDNRYGTRIHTIREDSNNGASSLVISNENAAANALDEVVRITSAGKVGVGLTNPTEKFEVQSGSIAIVGMPGGGGYKIDTHPLVSYSSFVLGGGNYAARLGSTGSSTVRHTQIYGGGEHIATFDGVKTRLGVGVTNPEGSITVVRNEASGYIASFRSIHASNSAQIIIDSPTDNNTRPSSIDLTNAGVIKWSLGQAYASTSSGAFHIATSKLQSNEDGRRFTITTGGNVGINSGKPGRKFTVVDDTGGGIGIMGTNAGLYLGTHHTGGFSNNAAIARAAANNYHITNSLVGDLCIAGEAAADILIGTSDSGSPTERMRIQSDGGISFGATGPVNSEVYTFQKSANNGGTSGQLMYIDHVGTDDHSCVQVRHRGATGSTYRTQLSFLDDNADQVGSIRSHGSATQYNTSSDYRLKENAVSITDGIERLKTLKPYRFNFKEDPSITVDGFFAHEVTAVPEAISGEKDGEEMQGMDYGRITPLLTAALQEAIAEIETLKAKVAALESN